MVLDYEFTYFWGSGKPYTDPNVVDNQDMMRNDYEARVNSLLISNCMLTDNLVRTLESKAMMQNDCSRLRILCDRLWEALEEARLRRDEYYANWTWWRETSTWWRSACWRLTRGPPNTAKMFTPGGGINL